MTRPKRSISCNYGALLPPINFSQNFYFFGRHKTISMRNILKFHPILYIYFKFMGLFITCTCWFLLSVLPPSSTVLFDHLSLKNCWFLVIFTPTRKLQAYCYNWRYWSKLLHGAPNLVDCLLATASALHRSFTKEKNVINKYNNKKYIILKNVVQYYRSLEAEWVLG